MEKRNRTTSHWIRASNNKSVANYANGVKHTIASANGKIWMALDNGVINVCGPVRPLPTKNQTG